MKKVSICVLAFVALQVQHAIGQLPSPVASYSFEGNADDQSGNGYDAELIGSASANGFLKLENTTSSYLVLPPSVMDGRDDFSVTFKIQFKRFHKSGSFPTNHILTGSSSSLDRIGLSYERINLTWRLAINGNTYSFSDLLIVNNWYCVVVTRAGNQAKLFVDGQLVGSSTVNGSSIPCTSLLVGQEEDCSGGCFAQNQCTNGKIDELTFYDVALSPQDVLSICNNAFEKPDMSKQGQSMPDIYPNPTNNFIYISMDESNIQYVEIYNLIGEMMKRQQHSSAIDVSDLDAGMYLIKVVSTSGILIKSSTFIRE